MKTIAILGVVTIHTISEEYGSPVLSFNWTSVVLIRCIVGASVPLFFLCSGALMLDPEKELLERRLFTKSLPRLLIALMVWATFYKLMDLVIAGTYSAGDLIFGAKEVLLFKHKFHLYFLHIMLLVYLWLPITRLVVAHASKHNLQYLLGIWFVFGIVYPTLRDFWPFTLLTGIPVQWLMNKTYAAIGYTVLGYYLKTYPISLRGALVCLISGFLIVFGGTSFLSVQKGSLATQLLEGMSLGIAVLTIGIAGVCFQKDRLGRSRVAIELSKASFCIYLVHVFFLTVFGWLGIRLFFPDLISVPLLVVLNVVLSYLVYVVLHKIPILRDWII